MSHPYKFGWVRDTPDRNDLRYTIPPMMSAAPLPASVDLRKFCTPAYDQLQVSSCTGNAIAGAIQLVCNRDGHKQNPVPSRLFIYYEERRLEGTTASDAGAMIRDGLKVVSSLGVISEVLWHYDASKWAVEPSPPAIYKQAAKHRVTRYLRVNGADIFALRTCLAARNPVVFGFAVYESFVSDAVAASGVMPMPGPTEQVLGGHAVAIVGYDARKQAFLCRNSWGEGWGIKGYFWAPFQFVSDFQNCSDFWTIQVSA